MKKLRSILTDKGCFQIQSLDSVSSCELTWVPRKYLGKYLGYPDVYSVSNGRYTYTKDWVRNFEHL